MIDKNNNDLDIIKELYSELVEAKENIGKDVKSAKKGIKDIKEKSQVLRCQIKKKYVNVLCNDEDTEEADKVLKRIEDLESDYKDKQANLNPASEYAEHIKEEFEDLIKRIEKTINME